LIFSREIRPEKNREIFGILQSHNKLSARHLHNWQLFTVDNWQAAALRLAVFHNFNIWHSAFSLFLRPFPSNNRCKRQGGHSVRAAAGSPESFPGPAKQCAGYL
jgi:hypothetical protein